MRILPSISWSFHRDLGSGKTDVLMITGDWRLAEIDNVGSAPVEYNTVLLHEIDGAMVSGYTIQPRPMTIGIMYTGARNQKTYYEGKRRLSDYIRPNQYKPVKLYVTLPSTEQIFLTVYPTPGAPMSLGQDRSRIFLEPVSLTAYNPIYERVEKATAFTSPGSVVSINAPNQAEVSISTDTGAVTDNSIKVDLDVSSSGSGGPHAGFYVEIKKTTEVDSAYVRTDVGAVTEHTFTGLDDQTGYSIRSIAYNSGGNSVVSAVITQATPQYVPPLEAPVLSSSVSPTSITLTWNVVTNATGYRVRHKRTTDPNYGSWSSISSTTYTLSSLSQQVTYDFQVEASFTLDDNSVVYGTTAEISPMTEQYDPPGVPRNVRRDGNHFRFEWDAPSGGGPVTRYRYFYGSYERTTTGRSARRPAEHSSRNHYFRVRAEGPGGNSSYETGYFFA